MSPAESSTGGQRQSTKAIRKACTVCRTLKTRCLPSSAAKDDLAPCARCSRLDLICDYSTKRRGRPITIGRRLASLPTPRSLLIPDKTASEEGLAHGPQNIPVPNDPLCGFRPTEPLEPEPAPQALQTPLPFGLTNVQNGGLMPAFGEDKQITWASSALNTPSPFTAVEYQYGGAPPNDMRPPQPVEEHRNVSALEPYLGSEDSRSPTPEHNPADLSVFDPRRILKPRMLHHAYGAEPAVARVIPDMENPIELNLLSEAEAMYLYRHFMDWMAPLIFMFDDAYHNFQFIRRSSLLFSSIMAVTARFMRPDLYLLLKGHAELITHRRLQEGVLNLQAVQALIVLAFWETPKDLSAPLKIALAVRAGYLLHLADNVNEPCTLDSLAAREKLDRERTWAALLRSETICCSLNRVPASVDIFGDEIPPYSRWADEHGHFGIATDNFVAFAFSMIEILRRRSLSLIWPRPEAVPPTTDTPDPRALSSALQQHLRKWLAKPALSGVYRTIATIATTRFCIQLEAELLREHPTEEAAERLLHMVDNSFECLRELAVSGHLRYSSEHSATSILMPGLTLFHVRHLLPTRMLSRCANILRWFGDLCASVPLSHEEHALHHVARSYHRVLGVFERLIASSTASSANGAAHPGTQLNGTFVPSSENQGGGESGPAANSTSHPEWHDDYDGQSFDALWDSMLTLPL